MYFIALIKMLMITEGVRCGVPAVLAWVWCIIGAHPPGTGPGLVPGQRKLPNIAQLTLRPPSHRTRHGSGLLSTIYLLPIYIYVDISLFLSYVMHIDNAYLLKDYFGWDCYILSSLDSDLSLR